MLPVIITADDHDFRPRGGERQHAHDVIPTRVQDFRDFSWADLQAAADDPFVNPVLNPVQTLVSSADDLVSFYSRALRGAFFKNAQTTSEFRRILTLADAIYKVPVPLGVSAYLKGGSIDTPGLHALSLPGAMYFDDRWVFYAFTLIWDAKAQSDPATAQQFVAAVGAGLDLVKESLERR